MSSKPKPLPHESEDLQIESFDSCPLNDLLDARVDEMSDEELEAHAAKLRQLTESPQTLRAALSRGKSSTKRKPKKQVDISGLL